LAALNVCTVTFLSGAPVAASVTVPDSFPPRAMEKLIPVVVEPSVTTTGVPVMGEHAAQSRLL